MRAHKPHILHLEDSYRDLSHKKQNEMWNMYAYAVSGPGIADNQHVYTTYTLDEICDMLEYLEQMFSHSQLTFKELFK